MICPNTLRRVACASLCLLSPFTLAATQPVFPVLTYEPYAVSSPLAMAEGDLNGDGITDTLYAAASTTAGSTNLTSAPRSATGAVLTPIAAGTIPCTANSILLADLNNDSKLDAVVTCNEGVVAVLAGKGDGTFATATTYSVASGAKAVAADLNADGYPDLAVAMNSGNTTSTFAVLLNAGTSNPLAFATPKVYGGAYGGKQIMTGDLNNDGKLDLVAGGNTDSATGPSAGIFLGNGDGTFQVAPYSFWSVHSIALGSNAALADFDGDGHTDIASAFANYGLPIINQVALSFPNESKNYLFTDVLPGVTAVQAIDINNDGHADIVLTGSTNIVLLNDGTGNMKVGKAYASPGVFYTARKGTAGADLVFTTPRGFCTLHGDGKGNFDGLPALYRSDKVATADLSGDGLTDLVASEQSYGAHYSFFGRGDGTYFQVSASGTQVPATPLLGDFNGDGVLDLVEIYSNGGTSSNQTSGNESRMIWSKGGAGGTFTRVGASSDLGVKSAATAVAGDFDGDGKLDFATAYSDPSYGINTSGIILVRGNGDGTFLQPQSVSSFNTSLQARLIAADLNGDGKLDLVWGNTAYINKGADDFTPIPLPVPGTAMAVTDLDGDGIPDVIIDNAVYAGKGDGSFLAAPLSVIATPAGSSLVSASIGDLNGDGNADIVIEAFSDMATLIVAYGDGHGNFTIDTNPYTFAATRPLGGTSARLNNSAPSLSGDNRLDYIAFVNGAAISLLNQSNPAPGKLALYPTTTTIPNPPSAYPLQTVTIQAQVSGIIYPTGTITYTTSDGKVLGQVSLQQYVGYSYTNFQTSFANEGTYTITATYSGDDINAPSVSIPVTVKVAKFASTTLILNSGAPYYTNRTSAIYAQVNAFNPTGQLTFSSGSNALGSAFFTNAAGAGAGSYQTHLNYVFDTPGTYSIIAGYPGDASNLPSTSSSYTITVTDGPDFALSATPMSNTVKAGGTATYTINITSLRNYSGHITLSCQPTCPTSDTYLDAGGTLTGQFTVQTNSPGTGSGGPVLRYGPPGAALLLFGLRRKYLKCLAPRLHIGLFAACLGLFLLPLAACSSSSSPSSSSSSSGSSTGTPYNIVLTAADNAIGLAHSITLQLIILN